ncbi:hypothetical protein [Leptothermofonsia sp. ETS-13]|uniref:hypothetical protein n=1 Tax=Leptothermofonsia sp. ETS-13 TaxID=3035696 RepID=UPI003BA09ADC
MLSPIQSVGVGLTLASIYLINQRDVISEKISQFQKRSASEANHLPQAESAIVNFPKMPVRVTEHK